MAEFTAKLDLYKPGGGLSGTNLPDEVADIDKLNDNFDLIDEAIGWTICTSTTRPVSPFHGKPIYERDTKKSYVYDETVTDWAPLASSLSYQLQSFKVADKAARDLVTGMVEGDMLDQADNETRWRYNGTKWVIISEVVCSLRKSANQNLTVAAAPLIWDVELSDSLGMHDNVTNNTRITAKEPGIYEVIATVYNGNAAGLGQVHARLNGAAAGLPGSLDRKEGMGSGGAAIALKSIFPVVLAVDDYIEIMVSHATAVGFISGGSNEFGAALTVKRIGPA